jgi:hypothetical protein
LWHAFLLVFFHDATLIMAETPENEAELRMSLLRAIISQRYFLLLSNQVTIEKFWTAEISRLAGSFVLVTSDFNCRF